MIEGHRKVIVDDGTLRRLVVNLEMTVSKS